MLQKHPAFITSYVRNRISNFCVDDATFHRRDRRCMRVESYRRIDRQKSGTDTQTDKILPRGRFKAYVDCLRLSNRQCIYRYFTCYNKYAFYWANVKIHDPNQIERNARHETKEPKARTRKSEVGGSKESKKYLYGSVTKRRHGTQ